MDQPNDPAHSPRAEKIPLDLGSNWTHPNRGPLAQAIVFGPFVSLTAEVKARIFPTVPSFRRRGAERGWALIAGGAEEKAKDKAEVGERGGGGRSARCSGRRLGASSSLGGAGQAAERHI